MTINKRAVKLEALEGPLEQYASDGGADESPLVPDEAPEPAFVSESLGFAMSELN
jgi:hypothetical protein